MEGEKQMIIDEKIYKTNCEIKYFFQQAKYDCEHLIVIFSSFNSKTAIQQHSYNYIRALSGFNCHKLFILDSYGPRGSYYLGENMNFEVETSVVSLITYIASKYQILNKNIVSVGSSKGGSAALYYGLKYNFGNIVAGAPQTRIADYILRVTEETAKYMLGETLDNVDRIDKLNNIIFYQFEKEIRSKIYLLTSKNDTQFEPHIVPLLDVIKQKALPI